MTGALAILPRKINVLQFKRNCVQSPFRGLFAWHSNVWFGFILHCYCNFLHCYWLKTWGKNRSHNTCSAISYTPPNFILRWPFSVKAEALGGLNVAQLLEMKWIEMNFALNPTVLLSNDFAQLVLGIKIVFNFYYIWAQKDDKILVTAYFQF